MGKVLEQISCPNPECRSHDAFTIYVDDQGRVKDATCFSCGYWTNNLTFIRAAQEGLKTDQVVQALDDTNQSEHTPQAKVIGSATRSNSVPVVKSQSATSQYEQRIGSVDECLLHPIRELKSRGISHATCEKYGVRVGVDTRDGVTPIYHLYPAYKDGELSGFFQRILPKTFLSIGDCTDTQLFGSHCVNPTGKKLFITEGVLDCLSLYQVLRENSGIAWEPAVVSLPNGANSAVKSVAGSMDLINGYEEIILVLDNDPQGKEATQKLCKMLAGKVSTVRLTEKDPNAMLLAGKGIDLKWAALTGAKKYQPDGIINGADCWDRYKKVSETATYPFPSSMPYLNEKIYGVNDGSIITITSGTGSGKTQFCRELKYHYLKTTDFKIADISLEEDIGETIGGLLSLELNKRITLPDVKVTEEEERAAFNKIFGSGRIDFYDFFGGMDDENLFTKLKYYAHTGHKLIFLDHLSIIVSEFAANGGERERIDTIMTKLAKFVKETGCILFLVVHLRKTDGGKSFEEGAVPTLDDLRGSGTIKQLSWTVLGLSRNQQHPDHVSANTTEITVLKSRSTGRTGHAGYLYFDDSSGRMIQGSRPIPLKDTKNDKRF